MTEKPKPRGFAAMSPERRREISIKGGASVAPENRAFARNPDLAAAAGRRGGSQPRKPHLSDADIEAELANRKLTDQP